MSQFIEMFGDNVSKKKISDVCDVRGGSTPTRTTKEFWNNGTISWFTIEDIYEQGRYISETKQHITELATKKCFVYPVDTVLICCTASVGEYAITKKEMASNQQFNGMMIKDKSELHPEYLLYVASTLKEDLLRQAGKTTINFVSRSKLENIEIPVPPYSEQLGFVSVYRQADKSGFDELKSQFIEMFGDPMVNDKQWSEYSCISEITQIVLGSTPNSKEPSYWDGDIRWITPAEMTDQSYYIFDTVRHITDEGRKAANLTVLPEGAVLFSTRAPIGKVAIVGKEMCCNQGFKNFICSEKLNNVFLYYTLKLKKDYLCSLGTGTTFKELSKRTVESLKIAVPPIELQNQFETIYNQADKSGSVLQYMIAC